MIDARLCEQAVAFADLASIFDGALGYPVTGDDIRARLAAMTEDWNTAVYVARIDAGWGRWIDTETRAGSQGRM